MALAIKYNVYYSTSPTGPWILANDTPIDHSPDGNSLSILGLTRGTLYYVIVVGGIVSDGEFVALTTQPLRPGAEQAAGVGNIISKPVAVRYHVIRKALTTYIGHQFLQGISSNEPPLYQVFDVNQAIQDVPLGQEWDIDLIDTWVIESGNYQTNPFTQPLTQEFTQGIAAMDELGMEFYVLLTRTRSLGMEFFHCGDEYNQQFTPSGCLSLYNYKSAGGADVIFQTPEHGGSWNQTAAFWLTASGNTDGQEYDLLLEMDDWDQGGYVTEVLLDCVSGASLPPRRNYKWMMVYEPSSSTDVQVSIQTTGATDIRYSTGGWSGPDNDDLGLTFSASRVQNANQSPTFGAWNPAGHTSLTLPTFGTGDGQYLVLGSVEWENSKNTQAYNAIYESRMTYDVVEVARGGWANRHYSTGNYETICLIGIVPEDETVLLESRYLAGGANDAYIEHSYLQAIPLGHVDWPGHYLGFPSRLIETTANHGFAGVANTYYTLEEGSLYCMSGRMLVVGYADWLCDNPWNQGALQIQIKEETETEWRELSGDVWNGWQGSDGISPTTIYTSTGIVLNVNSLTFPDIEAGKIYNFRLRYKAHQYFDQQVVTRSLLVAIDERLIYGPNI